MHFLKISDPWRKGLVGSLLVLVLLSGLVMYGCSGSAEAVDLNVLAGLGMMDAVKAVNDLYQQANNNITIIANFAASGTLQKQIEQGAPADVFISAGAAQMDALQKQQLIIEDTRKNLLQNKVVLIVPVNSALKITSLNDLTGDTVKKIAIGDPSFVPAGTYAQQAFDLLGITDKIKSKLVLAADVRQVLAYVEAGNCDAGIVFATDAAISGKVQVAASAPEEINSKIVFPVAIVKSSKNMDSAKAYINYLSGPAAKAIFEKYGFAMAGK